MLCSHFYNYAPEKIPYAQKRYLTEAQRIVTVLDKQLAQHTHVAGPDYSIADMAILPWVDYFLKAVTHNLTLTLTQRTDDRRRHTQTLQRRQGQAVL